LFVARKRRACCRYAGGRQRRDWDEAGSHVSKEMVTDGDAEGREGHA
jgi:hypothetical protein